MLNDKLEKLSDETQAECTDDVYVWFNADGTLCLDGNFTIDDLKMIIRKLAETTR
jgi:hypothetical protein